MLTKVNCLSSPHSMCWLIQCVPSITSESRGVTSRLTDGRLVYPVISLAELDLCAHSSLSSGWHALFGVVLQPF